MKVLITPSLATEMLKTNTGNRALSKPTIDKYVKDMINGRWIENTGESIKVSHSGKVLDGQHRLYSVIKSQMSIWMHIAYGLNDSVFTVLDTGKLRNATDSFKVAGVLQSNSLPSIMATSNLLNEGIIARGASKDLRKNNAELLEQYYENPEYWYNISVVAHTWYIAFAKILPPSVIGGLYAHLHTKNEALAYDFLSQLCTGKEISNESITLLRNKLIIDKTSNKKLITSFKMALILKTWNYFVRNQVIKVLRFDPLTEPYPTATI